MTIPEKDERKPVLLELRSYIPALLTWVYNGLSSDASKAFRKWHGLGVTDWRVLAFLGVNNEGTAATISRIISLDKAATSRSIRFLKDADLVATEQLPGRNIRLMLTPLGRKKFEEVAVLALDREEALLTGFSQGERALLRELLHRMHTNLTKVSKVLPRDSV